MNNFGEKANFIFGIADLIRDTFNRGKYRDVILPFTVLRRIDYVLEPTKKQVLEEYEQFKDSFPEDALGDMLRETSKYAFYNTSKFTFESLLEDPDNLAANLKDYINGFSENMRDVLEKLDFRNTVKILFGSTLANPQHNGSFDYMLANPLYGKDWKGDKKAVDAQKESGGRFDAGLPRISDGQLLFLQDMLSRMQEAEKGGSRVGIVMNGSPLFTGDAGSGESEIRRWILENDWLDAIVALPEQLFYRTHLRSQELAASRLSISLTKQRLILVVA